MCIRDRQQGGAGGGGVDEQARQQIAAVSLVAQANRGEIADINESIGQGFGKLRGIFVPNNAALHDLNAYLMENIAGERDGDIAIIEHLEDFEIEFRRYDVGNTEWIQDFSFSTDQPLAWATRGNGERMPIAKLPQAIPFANMRAKLFDSEIETGIAAANVNLAFDVNDVIGGETIAMAGYVLRDGGTGQPA